MQSLSVVAVLLSAASILAVPEKPRSLIREGFSSSTPLPDDPEDTNSTNSTGSEDEPEDPFVKRIACTATHNIEGDSFATAKMTLRATANCSQAVFQLHKYLIDNIRDMYKLLPTLPIT